MVEGDVAKISIKRPSPLEGLHKAEVVLAIDHKGDVQCLKSRYFDPEDPISPDDMINLCTHFIAHSCMTRMAGKNAPNFKMFKEAMSKDIKRALEIHMVKEGVPGMWWLR